MFYSKETLFAEFDVAKSKDIKLGKGDENKVHSNRVQFFKDHKALKQTNPEYYDGIDVNFDNLLLAYQSPNPRDHFYKTIFGKTYAEKMAESEIEKMEREASRN